MKQSKEGKRLVSILMLQARHNEMNRRIALDRFAREVDMKKKPKNLGAFRVDVGHCARCGLNHQSVLFVPFTRPPRWWTHYADCPKTKEPILMRKTED